MGASAARLKSPATLVDALGDAPSDGGSIPPASTLQGGDLPRTFASRGSAARSARSGNVPDPPQVAVRVPRQPPWRARRSVLTRGPRRDAQRQSPCARVRGGCSAASSPASCDRASPAPSADRRRPSPDDSRLEGHATDAWRKRRQFPGGARHSHPRRPWRRRAWRACARRADQILFAGATSAALGKADGNPALRMPGAFPSPPWAIRFCGRPAPRAIALRPALPPGLPPARGWFERTPPSCSPPRSRLCRHRGPYAPRP